jgi:hypothetical protein
MDAMAAASKEVFFRKSSAAFVLNAFTHADRLIVKMRLFKRRTKFLISNYPPE